MSRTISNYKKIINIFFLSLYVSTVQAQMNPNVHMVDMSHFLPYILPFYGLTVLSLAVLIHKIIRKQTSMVWVYVLCVISIVGALILSSQVHQFSEEVLGMDPESGAEHMGQGTFWRIGMPNIIIGILAIIMQRVNKNQKKADPLT